MTRTKGGLAATLAVGAVSALVVAGCGSSGSSKAGSSGSSPKVNLSLVAYSTPQAAYKKIIEAFKQTSAGKNITFTESYGASGDQSRAVVAGLPADVVEFSLAPDMDRLAKANLVDTNWAQGQYGVGTSTAAGQHKGDVTDSVVVIATRKGNPKHISDWPDLVKSGIQVITPNPFTSGGARWNVMAAYGGVLAEGKTTTEAATYLQELFKNHVPVQDDSARKSLQTFVGGKGDAMLAYENDAIFAQQNAQSIDYTVPKDTILIENPIAVTKNSKHPAEAQAFVNFLFTDTAQKIFSDNGYRPVVTSASSRQFPAPSGLFTIAKFGGWTTVTSKFFDPDTGVLASIEKGLGVPTKK
ncbi:MAG: sulfate ABC transporter substrate-binding protein [Actinomycetes bacterium]